MSASSPAEDYRLVCLTTRRVPVGVVVERLCVECGTAVWVSQINLPPVKTGHAMPTCVACVRALITQEDLRWKFGPEEQKVAAEIGILGELRKHSIMLRAGTMTMTEHLNKIVGDRW